MKKIYLFLFVLLCIGSVGSLIANDGGGTPSTKPPVEAETVVMSVMSAPITAEVTDGNNLETSFDTPLGIISVTVADDATGIVYAKRSVDTSRTQKLPIKVLSSSGQYSVTYTDANGNKIQHGKFKIK
ncbi:hypothetical protein M2451_002430 [Dysgonomonas sp. PFB1-18]|uniref:DUF3244 domain-containing protein n=1 Tax=unclassified Dysgonomonas TaxID=2630389 RepID=UPI002475A14C|nr:MULTISPECIES: DUF3244 domain-containing protein [unclassified Dysgonomonas]MDH6307196.1 hypothetical protein [Dysgonomonas sp. PF1-14]MDH6337115.1 hypothetical protein [Dysgonomonas sp. PF1-16]MDH6381101.1 hypothetical protein [Dysgonomonas sp. PFB1-18]MDH6396320.1 hypothetical protein [Dysgonomonas sp. PF1-23]